MGAMEIGIAVNANQRNDESQEALNTKDYGKEQLEELVLRLTEENSRLRRNLQQAWANLAQKDTVILEWISVIKGWKAVSIALREESQATSDREHHPLAFDSSQRCTIYRDARLAEHSRLKDQLYPPTSWRPR